MKPGIYHQTFYHDDNCVTLVSRDLRDCKCKPELVIEKSTGREFTEKKIKNDILTYLRNKAKFN